MRTVFHWDSQRFLSNDSTEIRKRRGSTWIVFIKPFRQAPICSVNILVLDPMRSPLRHLSLSLFQNWAIFHLSTRSHEMFFVFQFGHLLFPQERVTTVLNWFTELKTNRAENFMAENFRHGIRRWPSSLSASFLLLYWGGFSSLRQPRSLNLWFYVHKTS